MSADHSPPQSEAAEKSGEEGSSASGRDFSAAARVSPKAYWIAWAAVLLIRTFSATFRWRLHDPANLVGNPPDFPMIWAFWHNRIFALFYVHQKYLKTRHGAILSSASRDGEIIAAFVSRLGFASVRGSSSRRGAAALLGLTEWVRDGFDVAVVPDGPRGPRYKLGPGIVKLSQVTNAQVLPVRVEYGSYWTFRSWDRFRLPKPFTTVDVYFESLIDVPKSLDDAAFEEERLKIEKSLNPSGERD